MIEQKTFFVAKCDNCKTNLDSAGAGGFTVYETRSELIDGLIDSDWRNASNNCYCDECRKLPNIKKYFDDGNSD